MRSSTKRSRRSASRDRADVRVGKLSGGQRKRASIGVELLTRPRALFLDEPTSGLDPATAYGLMRTLRQLADNGTTVVLTTHSTDDLRQCDRVVFLAPAGASPTTGPSMRRRVTSTSTTSREIYEQLARSGEHGHDPQRRGPVGATPRDIAAAR